MPTGPWSPKSLLRIGSGRPGDRGQRGGRRGRHAPLLPGQGVRIGTGGRGHSETFAEGTPGSQQQERVRSAVMPSRRLADRSVGVAARRSAPWRRVCDGVRIVARDARYFGPRIGALSPAQSPNTNARTRSPLARRPLFGNPQAPKQASCAAPKPARLATRFRPRCRTGNRQPGALGTVANHVRRRTGAALSPLGTWRVVLLFFVWFSP